ncbi:MAG: 5-formyltetrahydrofolate cyclo-ligase [Nitrospirota bacterium]|nr:5-formyltetrahydrofolate cyclo-ligase [Nitrospirota bacterium]
MKKKLRKEIIEIRNSIPSLERKKKDLRIMKKLFTIPEFKKAQTVLFYASFRTEVNTIGMMKESLKMGKRVVLPKVDKDRHKLNLYQIKDAGELSPGYSGIPEPFLPNERLININEVDLVIVPGAGFDYSGSRLGYGAGYYDALLSNMQKKIPFIALAYEEQLVQSIPSELYDVKVNMIITDKQVIKIT